MTNDSLKEQFQHGEAFCLMKYASDDLSEVEWLWNSRDGVTSFIIGSKDKKQQLVHVDWHLDVRLPPEFLPPDDMRLFVDATRELLADDAKQYVDLHWEPQSLQGEEKMDLPGMSTMFADKQEAIEATLTNWLSPPGAPMVITGKEYKERLTAREVEI